MQNWQKNRNYRKHKNANGTLTYTITVDNVTVKVSAEIYKAYASADRKMEYMESDLKRDRVLRDAKGKTVKNENGTVIVLPEREMSLDRLLDDDWDFVSADLSPEEIFFMPDESEEDKLRRCISLLTNEEQSLIIALFFEGKTERQYAKIIGISKTALHARKKKVLEKIKSFMKL